MQSSEFVKRLEEIYSGEPWFGESILTKLKGISSDQAFQQPKAGEHSIAELLSHMEFWRKSILYRIKGDGSIKFSMEHPDNWPTLEALKKQGWKKLQQSFGETHESLVKILQANPALTDEQASNLLGTIEHDIYHLGQIGMVKKLVG